MYAYKRENNCVWAFSLNDEITGGVILCVVYFLNMYSEVLKGIVIPELK